MDSNLTIIGCGNMGSAIVGAILQNNIVPASDITLIEKISNDSTKEFESKGATHLRDIDQLKKKLDLLILAIKPQGAKEVLKSLNPYLKKDSLILSIMAGISIQEIEAHLGTVQVVRAMPNTPCSVHQGMSVYCGNNKVELASYHLVDRILGAMGKAIQVDEEKMIDAATAISGSGPAYIFYLAEALQEGAEKLGFTPSQAKILATQTMLGASTLLDQSTDSASILRRKVTSPGGTTEAALKSFESNRLKEKLIQGFVAAFERSIELGKN